MSETQGAGIPITDAQLRETLTAMHHGIIILQQRIDDHEKVIEKMMLVIESLTSGRLPDGFRQPPKGH